MAPQDNMLEIFREAGKTSTRTGSAGPFGGGEIPGGGLPPVPSGGPRGLVFLGSLLIAFVLGIAVGRQFAPKSSVEAGPSNGGSTPDENWLEEESNRETPARSNPSTNAGGLRDPRNLYSVVVVTYNDSGNSRDFAFETVDHLRGKYGIDVHEPLLWGDGKILVLAGAAPTRADLARLVEKIETATGPDGKPNAFKDPYIVEIDDYVGR